jgi:uncharacterized membrane protein YphA (DoxX/SURF4 family)
MKDRITIEGRDGAFGDVDPRAPDQQTRSHLILRCHKGETSVAEYFGTLCLPMPAQMAAFIACVEFFGGIFLAMGLLSRITGLVLTVNMTMAYVMGNREALLSFFSDPDKFTAAAPFAFLLVSLIVLIFGAGKISADTAIMYFFGSERVKQANSVPA